MQSRELQNQAETLEGYTIESNLESINVVVTFKSVDETLVCDHSNESYWAILSCGAVCFWKFCIMKFKIFSSVWTLALEVKGLTPSSKHYIIRIYCYTAHSLLLRRILWRDENAIFSLLSDVFYSRHPAASLAIKMGSGRGELKIAQTIIIWMNNVTDN